MALVAAVAGTPLADSTNTTPYATASWTPTAGRLYLVAVTNSDASNAILPTMTGNGQTWAQVATQQHTAADRRITIFRCLAASPSAGALSIDFAGDNQTGCAVHISEWTGFDTSGTNGSGAIVQSVTFQWSSAPNPSVTLAAFANASNGTYGAFATGGTFSAPGSGFTQLSSNGYTLPGNNLFTEWRADNDTTVDATAGSGSGCAIAIEVAASPVVTFVPYRNPMPPLIAQ